MFSYPVAKGEPVETRHEWLMAYLQGASASERYLTVQSESRPINEARPLRTGVQMIDDGHFTFESTERVAFLEVEPEAKTLFKRYLGGDEFINGFHRWILYLRDAPTSEIRRLHHVRERVAKVREYRTKSSRPSTVRMAETPALLGVDERLTEDYLVVPNTSSERREYIPIGWLGPEVIANQKLRILPRATFWEFAVLTSAMHMAWMRTVTGRLKSDYMYSVSVVYNTFPWPEAVPSQRAKIEALAQAVLDARAMDKNTSATLADLYDPDFMPPELRKAHRDLDAAVDKLYNPRGFADERARVEHLFRLYERLVDPLTGDGARQNARVNRAAARAARAKP